MKHEQNIFFPAACPCRITIPEELFKQYSVIEIKYAELVSTHSLAKVSNWNFRWYVVWVREEFYFKEHIFTNLIAN